MKKMILLSSAVLLALSFNAQAQSRYSTVPHQTQVVGKPYQQMPESLAHWQQMAEELADQAAPSLSGIVVSSQARGKTSAFDLAFHDFFISALHRRGVEIHYLGAPVEIDTYPLAFVNHKYRVRNHQGERGVAPPLEFGVNVRVFYKGYLAYSGSQTYYIPTKDYHNYKSLGGHSKTYQTIKVKGDY